MADWTPESRVEEILYDTINGEEYTGLPESRIEELLLELKEVIEEGGTTNYNALENKPQINSVTLSGDKSLADLGIIAEIKKVMDMITGQFSTESDYSEGDIVIYDKKLYVFTTDHTAGQWNSLEVSQTTIEDLLSSIPLSGLSDTDIETPSAGEPLIYDAISSKWKNGGIIPIANGGTGNNVGYIRTGARANNTIGNNSTIEGYDNVASGQSSHAEGHSNVASGNYGAHAEGSSTTASGTYSHAEGLLSSATHNYAHAEGSSVASAQAAHSEGEGSTASAFCAHAGGNYGAASGSCSFSHGSYTNATAECSVAMGRRTNAGYVDQFIAGKYNSNKSTSIFEIGNGTGDGNRSNAIEVDTNGNTKIAGSIVAGGYIDDGYGHRLGFNKKTKINPFPEGASTITLYHENGITPISTSITDGVGMVDFNESQNGYEGFCIELNVTVNTCYKIEFDYQNVDCQYWENRYTLGYQLTNTAVTDYINQSLWTNNIQRTTGVQHFTASITSTGSKVYLCFNVCAYSDSRTNHATLSNLTVYELQEGTEDLSNYVQKSLTAGLLKNDGTVDTDTFVKTSNTAGLLKNDGTVDTTTYASEAGTESLIDSTVGWTGKNLLENTASTFTTNGVTFTVNSDGTVIGNTDENGATGTAVLPLCTWFDVKPDAYIVSGCSGGQVGDTVKYQIGVNKKVDGGSESAAARNREGDTSFDLSGATTAQIYAWIEVRQGTVLTNQKFYPMLRDARITDPTYEPYHKSVEECLEDINDKLSYLEQSVTLSTSASTTVTFTDSSITANSFIEYACSQWDLVPESITGAAGSCTIVLPKVDSAQSVTVRIYVR